MNTKKKLLLFLAGATLLMSGCASKDLSETPLTTGSKVGEMSEMLPCAFAPDGGKDKVDALCGVLTVPENWKDANSRLITLPVVKIPSTSATPAEPIFYLKGGPGSSNLAWNPPAWILEKHDVIMVGYRGADGSVVLNCPEVDEAAKQSLWKKLFSEERKDNLANAARQCLNRLIAAGVDLEGYMVSGVIADMEAARIVLGYEKIDLYSRSYGTRIAQLYVFRHPEVMHRVVMAGLNTPGHFIYNRDELDMMFREISAHCAADPDCSQRTEDLAQTIYDVNRNAPGHWLFLPIDLDMVRFGTHAMMFSTSSMSLPIDMYLSAGEGDYSGMAFFSLVMKFQTSSQIWGDTFYKGGSLDLEYYKGVESVNLGDTVMGAPLAEYLWQPVGSLFIALDDADLRVLQENDVDILVVNGSLDFSTPPMGMEKAKPYWHNAKFVLLPKFSHVGDLENLQPEAYQQLITNYYDNDTVDTSLFKDQPLSFKPKIGLAMMAKLLIAVSFVLLFVLILITWRLINKSGG
ncbi:MAG: hypothetical protein HY863_14265 [Chloroflexi bacterium]|nr:hypothetical protein [Chloroflexota bacterium]